MTAMAMHVLTGEVTFAADVLLTSLPVQGYCDMVRLGPRGCNPFCGPVEATSHWKPE